MTSAFALAALLSLPGFGQPADLHRERLHVGLWTVTVVQARFAERAQCRLSARGMDWERGALVIQLSPKADTFDAVYRIDGGPPHSVRGDAPELARLGFALHKDDLSNPSGGLVPILGSTLAGAAEVAVQVRPGAPVRRFRVDALARALEAARTAGCAPEAFQ